MSKGIIDARRVWTTRAAFAATPYGFVSSPRKPSRLAMQGRDIMSLTLSELDALK